MSETTDYPSPQPEHSNTATPLTVFLAYRDPEHERLGKAYWEALSRHLGWNGNSVLSGWKFEMLASPALRSIAATEAAEAHLVIISTASSEALPDGVKTWFECWCACGLAAPRMLVVVLSEDSGGCGTRWPDYSYLHDRIDGCGRRLVVYASGRPAENDSPFCLADARLVLSRGLVAVEEFPEATELVQPALPAVARNDWPS